MIIIVITVKNNNDKERIFCIAEACNSMQAEQRGGQQ